MGRRSGEEVSEKREMLCSEEKLKLGKQKYNAVVSVREVIDGVEHSHWIPKGL